MLGVVQVNAKPLLLLIKGVGSAFIVTLTLVLATQLFAFVTVTAYIPLLVPN